MKLKKLLSLFAAAAMGASCLAGFGISASAAVPDGYKGIDFVSVFSSNLPAADGTTTGQIKDGDTTLVDVTYLGGTWKYNSGIAPNSNPDRPAVSGGVYSTGCAIQFVPAVSGSVIVDRKLGNNKVLTIDNMTEKKNHASFANTSGSSIQHTDTADYAFDVEADVTYVAYATGTGDPFYGIYFMPVVQYTTVYDLPALVAGGGIQNKESKLSPSSTDEGSNAPQLTVDATSGKLGPNGDWAQINTGTVITLPRVAKGTKISFSEFYGTTALTIGDVQYNNDNKVFTAAEDGDVVMTCTTGGYIKAITAVGPAFSEAVATEGYTNTWYFGKSNKAPEFALQRSAEYTYEANGHALVVNTDSGKLNNASRTDTWCQCNDGTTFKVPVYAGSKLTWDRYNKGDSAGFKVDDVLYNDYYIAAEDGTVALKAQGISYLASIKIEPVAVYDVTGTVTGGDINGKSVIFTATNGQPYALAVSGGAISGKLPAGTYSVSLPGDVAYVVDSPASVAVSAAGDLGTIALAEATDQTVSGEITNAPAEAFTLTFTGSGEPVQVQLAAGADSYSVTLAPGTYTVSSSVGTLSPLSQESFTVVKDAVDFDLYYPETLPAATSNEITVGKGETFTSISDALAAVKAAKLSAPVITLHSGETYREQVIVDIPDVTFRTDGEEKATITWYYGIGYSYYSLADNGYYDKDRAMTRHSIKKVEPARWGATVLVRGGGSGFKAENIIFENSFNQYYTDEEVKDGVKPSGIQAITVDRQAQTIKADAKNATERAAAIGFENNPQNCELYKCEFIGSQDTFYTSGSIYVRDCAITGNTDYIFGGGNVVFDNCDLIWGGYSDGSYGGHITANSGDKYIFRGCTIKNSSKDGRTVAGGNLGRDWGGENAHVYYFNVEDKTGGNTKWAWTNMGGAVASGKADLHIYSYDPETNALYDSTGPNGANVNGLLTTQQAFDLYFRTEVTSDLAPAVAVAESSESFANAEDENDKASLWEAEVASTYAAKNVAAIAIDKNGNSASKLVRIGEGITGPVSVYIAVNKAASDIEGLAVVLN